jgi:GH24 family phage-related lysozyme (muramidase)
VKPTIEQLAAALIAVFEGPMKLVAYMDTGGVWTIGRGHTGRDVHQGSTITPEQGVALFASDQIRLLAMVEGLPLFAAAAYASFGYNCGTGALHAVLAQQDTIANPKHTTDRHGVVQGGLVSRRLLERLMIEGA